MTALPHTPQSLICAPGFTDAVLTPGLACAQAQQLAEVLRGAVTDPRHSVQMSAPEARARLISLLRKVRGMTTLERAVRSKIHALAFSSLDPDVIRVMGRIDGLVMLEDATWSTILPHVTPEVVDAFCEAGNNSYWIGFASPNKRDMPSDAALRRMIHHWRTPNGGYLMPFLTRARENGGGSLALYAVETFLSRWPVCEVPGALSPPTCLSWTVFRVLAALINNRGDALHLPVPRFQDHWGILRMTHSAHGRLMIQDAIPNLAQFITAPEPIIARFVDPALA